MEPVFLCQKQNVSNKEQKKTNKQEKPKQPYIITLLIKKED